MKITITDDDNKVLFEKDSAELTVAQIAAASRTREERRACGVAQVAAIIARRTPEQVAEAERIEALTKEEREVELAQSEKSRLEAQLVAVSDKVDLLQKSVSLKASPVGEIKP
jgi:hypothetical protein